MKCRIWRVVTILLLGLAVCVAASDEQPESVIVEPSPPLTMVRALGTLAVIAEFGGMLLLDDVEIATMDAGEEVVLSNVRTGQRHVEIRGAHENVTLLANVEKDLTTIVRFSGAAQDDSFYASDEEESASRSVMNLGGGVFFYDMDEPVLVMETAYSYYTGDDFAIGGFVGFENGFWATKAGIQATLGDTRVSAIGLRIGLFSDDVLLVGVCVYSSNLWLSLDYSFPDPGWAGEIHIAMGYSFRF